ncbi:MAG: glycosyltransferase [bacterium]
MYSIAEPTRERDAGGGRPIDVSVVVEMDTREITGGIYDTLASLRSWIGQADALAPRRCEILVSSSASVPEVQALATPATPVRLLRTPGASYYGLKNAGARAASGRIVVFSDSDCRPADGYLEAVVAAFGDPEVLCAAGVTEYDGKGLLTRIQTATSFGYLFRGDRFLERLPALSHNVAIRRDDYESDPFGPFQGRSRGDAFFTDACRLRAPIPIVSGMRILHEDPSGDVRGLLDRHLREIFSVASRLDGEESLVPPGPSWRLARRVLRSALKRPRRQVRLIRRFGPALGVQRHHAPVVALVFTAHALLDVVATTAILLYPPWTRRWLDYQFGRVESESEVRSGAG